MKLVSKKELLIMFIAIVLLMQNLLISQSNIWSYMDELITVACLLYYLFGNRILTTDGVLCIFLCGTMFLGVVYNFMFGIQQHYIAVIEDIISVYKFLFVYLGMKTFLKNRGIKLENILKVVSTFLKIYISILTVFALLNIVVDIGMSPEVRYGIRSFAFIYGTPGHLINQMSYSLIILYAEKEHLKKQNNLWIGLTIFVMLATLKTRAIILVFLYCALLYFFVYRNKKRIGVEIAIVLCAIALIGFSQFEYYFMNKGTPRQMFVAGAIRTMKDYFPFGAGFATYGSSAAADYYSPLYNMLGFADRWGMTPETPQFLNDNYLPMILGQFGVIAGILFLVLIGIYCKKVVCDSKVSTSINTRLITYFFVGDVVLSSIQSSYLAHYSVVTLSFFYFMFFYENRKLKENDS